MQKGVLLLMWGLFFCIASLFSATATRRAAAVGNEKKKISYCGLCSSDATLLQLRKNINADRAYLQRAKILPVFYNSKSIFAWTLTDIAEQQAVFDERVAQLYAAESFPVCSCAEL